jgi:hypothetical protein
VVETGMMLNSYGNAVEQKNPAIHVFYDATLKQKQATHNQFKYFIYNIIEL